MIFTQEDVIAQFGQARLLHAMAYVQAERVREIKRNGGILTGKVLGNANKPHTLRIELLPGSNGIPLKSQCDCASASPSPSPCAHVAALLLAYLQQTQSEKNGAFTKALAGWLNKLQILQNGTTPAATEEPAQHRLIFVMLPDASGKKILLTLARARLRADETILSAKEINDSPALLAEAETSAEDRDLIRLFIALHAGSDTGAYAEIRGRLGALCLQTLADAKKNALDQRPARPRQCPDLSDQIPIKPQRRTRLGRK